LEAVKKEAKRLKIKLTRRGKAKTKACLEREIRGKTGGAARTKRRSHTHRKRRAAPGGRTLETVKKEARRKHIPLSRNGKAKTKAQLLMALAGRR
jgi:hypothetical protein